MAVLYADTVQAPDILRSPLSHPSTSTRRSSISADQVLNGKNDCDQLKQLTAKVHRGVIQQSGRKFLF